VNFGRAEEAKGGQWDKATRYYTKAIEAAPDYALGYSNRANVYVIFGRLEEALTDYDRAVKVSSQPGAMYEGLPDRWLLFLNRGTTRLALNRDPQKCVDDFDQAAVLRNKPETLVVQNRAQAYERLGSYNLALGDYANAVALKSQEVQPFWLRYAGVLFEARRDQEALVVLNRVKTKFSGEAEVNVALAAILVGSGDQKAGLALYRTLPAVQRQKYGDARFLDDVVRWPPRLKEVVLGLQKTSAEMGLEELQRTSEVAWK